MTAAGMLAVGAMAIITGASWLLASALREQPGTVRSPEEGAAEQVINLNRLVSIMAYGVAVAATLLLAVTTHDYLTVAFPRHMPGVIAWSALATPILVGVASGALAFMRTRRARVGEKISQAGMSTMAVRFAAYGILAYAVVGPLLTGVISEFGTRWWLSPSVAVVGPAIGAGLVF